MTHTEDQSTRTEPVEIIKRQIDAMSPADLQREWQYQEITNPRLQGEAGVYFLKELKTRACHIPGTQDFGRVPQPLTT